MLMIEYLCLKRNSSFEESSLARCGMNGQLAAEIPYALLHADQTETAPAGLRLDEADAIVANRDGEAAGARTDCHVNCLRAGMAGAIGEGLLNNPVDADAMHF